ncbi:heme exporter protein CcmD [Rhodoplanes roseus]|uniref:Heme exporter protein D n=1 Tax=Rhodoplanes roseus TaxID=29409 RepID=A0A327KM27_9BRAD|nr:heme exporter protein CcmD [Rhodoplanes roseus]RAI38583.1 heme exporter protein CcmD [Rhodoplanes roseus]
MDLGPHAVFIVASYAVTLVIVVALIAWVWIDHRRQSRLLADLEARGVRRRSAEPAPARPADPPAPVKETAA